jgi:ATP-dependent Clp protease, protease subunit
MWLDDEDEKQKPEEAAKAGMVEEKLFKSRTVLITGQVEHKMAKVVTAQLLALAADGDDWINVFVSSPGGHVESGDMIYDMLKFVGPKVRVIGTGWVASAGALIFVGAAKENRFCLPNTRFLLHQPSGGMMGTATDIGIQAEQIIKMRDRLNKIFAMETGQPLERIAKDTDRDHWMFPEEAIAYGLLHKVIRTKGELG